jgi:hypothetical protein
LGLLVGAEFLRTGLDPQLFSKNLLLNTLAMQRRRMS